MAKFHKKIAILASENLLSDSDDKREEIREFEEEMGKLTPAFADMGMDLSVLNWRDAPAQAENFDAMLPLFVWDYFEGNEQEFFMTMAQVDKRTHLFNPFNVLKWNSNKSYLEELGNNGAAIIPAIAVDKLSKERVLRAMEKLGADKIVIKPDIGGNAWRQALYEKGAPFPDAADLPPQGALIQPFLASVLSEGELSFVYFGGRFSHAMVKRPKDGDYRVQSSYGGREELYTPSQADRMQVRAVLDVLDFTPLYARIDFLRSDAGQLLLIELELIEPYLYLPFAEGDGGNNKGAQKLAKALLKKLNG